MEEWAGRGYAVVSSGSLAAGATDFEIDVGSYDVQTGSTGTTTVGPTTLSVNAPNTDPYWLVVYVDSGGALQTAAGSEGTPYVGKNQVDSDSADIREIHSPAPPTLDGVGPATVLGRALITSDGVSDGRIDDRAFTGDRVLREPDITLPTDSVSQGALQTDAVGSDELATDAAGSDEIQSDAVGGDELATDAAGSDEIQTGAVGAEELSVDPIEYDPGMVEWEDGLADEEILRLGLQSGDSLVVERIEFRQKGGGSSASASIDVYDVDAAASIGSQDLGGTTKDPGSSGSGATVLVRVSNSTGGAIEANPRVIGYITEA
jgi:hypothetical protein